MSKKEAIQAADYDEEMTVTMELEDGESVTCAIITILTVNEKDYIILLPLDEKGENEDGEVWIYGYKEDESDPNAEPELFFIEDEDESIFSDKASQGTIELSKKESQKIESLKRKIAASVDKKTSMTSVTATFQDSKVAAVVADSVVKKLQEYIIDYRTSKSKEDCLYLEKLFKERQQEYYEAQRKYADYMDSHDNIILQSVRTEQERLQNDMSLAYQVYSQVAGQLQVARAKVQEEKPVFAVVEPAVVPLYPSGTSRKIYVLAFIFLSVCIVISWNLFGKDLLSKFKEVCA